MRLMNFYVDEAKKRVNVGLVTEDGVIDLNKAADAKGMKLPCDCGFCENHGTHLTMEKIIAAGDEGKAFVLQAAEGQPALPEDTLVHAPAVTNPEKIMCVGVNYRDHAAEANTDVPDYPVLFSKYRTALNCHNGEVPMPRAGENFDYEAELVVVIGKQCKHVSPEEALDYVFGYTIGNDVSMRKQFNTRLTQWITNKSPDGFAPVGPHIVTKDEVDCFDLDIKLYRNGVVKQHSNTKYMVANVPYIISYASQYFTFKPGDIIYTGTMAGVIMGKDTHDPWLEPGEEIVVEIEGIGRLRNIMA
ncbi:MAG: fumarylacetoacetate hydrolase family protein [Clostridiales bacterium]|nr:fumarylacetoacetate hydrolase family protein [Clostridiales bacterium]